MFDRMTSEARRGLTLARDAAVELMHDYIGTEHLAIGLARQPAGPAARVLERLGVTADAVREVVERVVESDRVEVAKGAQLPFTPRAKRVLERGLDAATHNGDDWIGTEHLLLGLVRETEGAGAYALSELGANVTEVEAALEEDLKVRLAPDSDATSREWDFEDDDELMALKSRTEALVASKFQGSGRSVGVGLIGSKDYQKGLVFSGDCGHSEDVFMVTVAAVDLARVEAALPATMDVLEAMVGGTSRFGS